MRHPVPSSSQRRRVKPATGLFVLVAATALVVSACSSSKSTTKSSSSASGESKKAYTIGLSEDATGTTGALFAGAAGLQAYFKNADAHGGVDGHQITVQELNDGGTAATAATDFTQLTGNGALAVVWSTLSNAYIPLETKAQAQKVPMFIISLLS